MYVSILLKPHWVSVFTALYSSLCKSSITYQDLKLDSFIPMTFFETSFNFGFSMTEINNKSWALSESRKFSLKNCTWFSIELNNIFSKIFNSYKHLNLEKCNCWKLVLSLADNFTFYLIANLKSIFYSFSQGFCFKYEIRYFVNPIMKVHEPDFRNISKFWSFSDTTCVWRI